MKCPKCEHTWKPRVSDPRRCPKCGKWLENKDDASYIEPTGSVKCPRCHQEVECGIGADGVIWLMHETEKVEME